MARQRLPSAWESAPDILRTESPPRHRHTRRSHSRTNVSHHTPDHRRRVSSFPRRGTYPVHHVNQWAEPGRDRRSPQRTPIVDSTPDPPHPVTPPLERPQPALPALGYRAPTPPPHPPPSSVPLPTQKPETKPPRLLQIQRHCAHRLDDSLPMLSMAALASGSILLVSAILFVRSVMVGSPHTTAGKIALTVFFSISVAAFVVAFGLILGVLCRRARATKRSVARVRAREELELEAIRARVCEGRLPMYNFERRNAICELRDEPAVGPLTIAQGPARDQGRLNNRPNAPPIRVNIENLPNLEPPRRASPGISRALSPLIPPSSSTPSIPVRNPARLVVAVAVKADPDADALSTTAQPSPESTVSPRTIAREGAQLDIDSSNVSGRSTQMFNRYMLAEGTRELQAYLNPPSDSSLNTEVVYQNSGSDSSSTHAIMSNDRSVYSHEMDESGAEEESRVKEASVLSLRKVGKARECFIPASRSTTSRSGSRKPKKQRRSGLKIFMENPKVESKKSETRKHQSMLDQLPSAPLLLSTQHNFENHPLQRSRSLSPKKLQGGVRKSRVIGLGISMGNEQDKENVGPGHREVETWSALGDD